MNTLTLPEMWNRHTVGFDRMWNLLESTTNNPKFPPHNIIKTGEETYRITMAIAGFSRKDIEIVVQNGLLTILGKKPEEDFTDDKIVYRGIATRDFQTQFTLGDHVEVTGAWMYDGMLTVELERKIPEAQKAKYIEIK